MHNVSFSDDVLERIRKRRRDVHMYSDMQPRQTSLLVVDMQDAFVAEGAAAEIPMAREIVPNINRLARALRAAGGLVTWIVSTYGPSEDDRWPTFFDHVMGPEAGKRFRDALTDGAASHRVYQALEQDPADLVVAKNRFGAFIGSNGRLEGALRERGIDTVLITGTVTNVCCETTAREAAALSFKTTMISDGNAARCDEEHNATLSTFLQTMGDVRSTEDVVASLAAGGREQARAARA